MGEFPPPGPQQHAVHGLALYINAAESDALRINPETGRTCAVKIATEALRMFEAGIVERLRSQHLQSTRFQLAIR